ncbi:TRAP transporter small permease subunit [Hahella ganghwensis]|uniref:TRAP transporter small permease subunit n=1 Tax=Hahella ganghwensis TaxID=286420 RepID=UPI00036A42AC|nr:TRAP transporter small permease subunit [Hahella ganghwensis]
MRGLVKTDEFLGGVSNFCGHLATFAMLLMLVNVAFDVMMRYVFNDVSIGMQELEWHLYSVTFLLGVPFAMRRDGHVRVDIIYETRSDRTKAFINLIGVVLFVIPFCALIAYYGYGFTVEAYELGEGSGDPGGLPYRWIVKSVIPLSAVLTGISGLAMFTQALRVLLLGETYSNEHKESLA